MAYNKYDCEKQGASYMDGIPVKISEQFKPPKKITVPGTILNKLNAGIVLPEYDFTLERSVMDKMSQWRQLRIRQREERRERLEAEKKAGGRVELEPTTEDGAASPPQTKPFPILTPVPSRINASTLSQSTNYSKSFNISDFEQDTSSPFDNMELKTINDLEELAHVLQPTVISDKNESDSNQKKFLPPRLNGFNAQYSFSDFSSTVSNSYGQISSGSVYPGLYQNPNPPSCQSYVVQRLDLSGHGSKSVPDIVQQLELELKGKREAESRRHLDLDQPQRPASIGPTEQSSKSSCDRTPSSLPNPYDQLTESCRQLVDRLAEMGFPLARVARAAQLFNDDETRIVEFLVQVQELEEKFPADRAEKALKANNYNHQETVQYLNSVDQLLGLGFKEDQVERVLLECGLDQNKALDVLIS